jgi:hypothetical protein
MVTGGPPPGPVDPAVLQTYFLDSINKRLEDMTGVLVSMMPKVPEGIIFNPELTVTGDKITEFNILEEPEAGNKPWFSCSIFNDGPDDVWLMANSYLGKFRRLGTHEGLDLDFKAPKLNKLYFKCGPVVGELEQSAALRITGER